MAAAPGHEKPRCTRWSVSWSATEPWPLTGGTTSMLSGTQLQPRDDRIAITGMGVVSPIGQGVEAFWSGLVNGVSGITLIERFPTSDLRVRRGGEIKQLCGTPGLERPLPACRASQLLIHAA